MMDNKVYNKYLNNTVVDEEEEELGESNTHAATSTTTLAPLDAHYPSLVHSAPVATSPAYSPTI
jgi:hypothetical protein